MTSSATADARAAATFADCVSATSLRPGKLACTAITQARLSALGEVNRLGAVTRVEGVASRPRRLLGFSEIRLVPL
jgi:hypothetical protein